jgi:hypothetical protein
VTKDEYEVYERVREQRDALRDALLRVEAHYYGCVGCMRMQNEEQRAARIHHVDCYVDAALTKAGLPDQAGRDAARGRQGT